MQRFETRERVAEGVGWVPKLLIVAGRILKRNGHSGGGAGV